MRTRFHPFIGFLMGCIHMIAKIYMFLFSAVFLLCMMMEMIGYEKYVVISGSMVPVIPVGSCIWVKEEAADTIELNDIVTYRMEQTDTMITHRVYELSRAERWFRTRGDANDVPDAATVSFDQVVGTVKLILPLAGYVLQFLNDPMGKLAAVSFFALSFGISPCLRKRTERIQNEKVK